MEYSEPPSRKIAGPISTSSNDTGNTPSSLSTVSVMEARLTGRRPVVPWKRTSSIFAPRTAVGRCSPMTQRIASLMLDLPQPLGPTMAVIPSWNWRVTASAKDLKPWSRRARSFIGTLRARGRSVLRQDYHRDTGTTGRGRPGEAGPCVDIPNM